MLNDLLKQLYTSVGPQATQLVSNEFDVAPDKAEQALPTVAPALFNQLQHLVKEPEQNLGTLLNVHKALDGGSAADTSSLQHVAQAVLGGQMGGLVQQLSGVLGTSQGQSTSIITRLAPMALQFLQKKGDGQGLLAILGPVLGASGAGGDKLKLISSLLQTGSNADDALGQAGKMLGNLFN